MSAVTGVRDSGRDGITTGRTADRVWLYATILTVGYMISRGIAKADSRQPHDENGF